MERILIKVFCIVIFLYQCTRENKDFKIPPPLYNKRSYIEIISQIEDKNYCLTLYWDKEEGTKYLFIQDYYNKFNVKHEILSHGKIRINYVDIDKDGKFDLFLDIFIGGTGVHLIQYVIYSTKYKEVFFQNIEFNNEIKFREFSKNLNKYKNIKKFLRDLTWLTNHLKSETEIYMRNE